MKVGILTSTRADFGIYLPLLKTLDQDKHFDTELIVFGTHLSKLHGFTVNEIVASGFKAHHKIETVPNGDSPKDIGKSIAKTVDRFTNFWSEHTFDLVFALGDRYEMFAAVSAGFPFGVKFAHLHAGETTLGAIDNAYRHSISLMSELLLVSNDIYRNRAIEINQNPQNVVNVGALSIDNLTSVELFDTDTFYQKFNIRLDKPTILTTFHPETVSLDKNVKYISELIQALDELKSRYQIVITMPNADTMGMIIRQKLETFGQKYPEIKMIESFGMKGYLTCMKHASFLLGNTSSGFVEAAYFPKWVINLGERQRGRIETEHIITVAVEKSEIIKAVEKIENSELPINCNIYGNGKAAEQIIDLLKKRYV